MPRTKEQFKKIREETRAKILYTSLELFANKGYSKTSISDIAKSAKISKGLVYNYFESKEKLMEGVIEILFVEIGNMFALLKVIKDPFEKLHKIIDLTFELLEEREDFWRLYSSVLMQQEMKDIAEEVTVKFMNEFLKELEKIFRKIRIKNSSNEARVFAAILDGVSYHTFFLREEYPIKKMRKFLKEKYSREFLNTH